MRRVVKLSHGDRTCIHGPLSSARSGRCGGFSVRSFYIVAAFTTIMALRGKHGCTFSDFSFLIQINSISDLEV
jgi:hypothetical protein